MRRVLVVDDDKPLREALAQTLDLADFTPVTAGSFVEAKDLITSDFHGVILSDIRMPGRDGFHLLDYAHTCDPDLPVILLTGEGDIPMAVRAMEQGAFGFLEKPCNTDALVAVLDRACRARQIVLENRQMRREIERGDAASRLLFGVSAVADQLRQNVRTAARAQTDVLVYGAAGTGVSKVAEVIHLCSINAKAAFVKRSAAAMTREAVTAAIEEAEGGTLFLDDIHAMPKDTQIALIDQLDGRASVRVIAGTNSDLKAAMLEGAIDADLFYRLEVMKVRVPSISERPEDIPVLFQKYVAQACEQAGLSMPEISPDMTADLMARDWPGNARSLMSEAMRFVMGVNAPEDPVADMGLVEQLAQVERRLIINALERAKGRATIAAEALKLPRKTFYDKLTRYGIKSEDFRN